MSCFILIIAWTFLSLSPCLSLMASSSSQFLPKLMLTSNHQQDLVRKHLHQHRQPELANDCQIFKETINRFHDYIRMFRELNTLNETSNVTRFSDLVNICNLNIKLLDTNSKSQLNFNYIYLRKYLSYLLNVLNKTHVTSKLNVHGGKGGMGKMSNELKLILGLNKLNQNYYHHFKFKCGNFDFYSIKLNIKELNLVKFIYLELINANMGANVMQVNILDLILNDTKCLLLPSTTKILIKNKASLASSLANLDDEPLHSSTNISQYSISTNRRVKFYDYATDATNKSDHDFKFFIYFGLVLILILITFIFLFQLLKIKSFQSASFSSSTSFPPRITTSSSFKKSNMMISSANKAQRIFKFKKKRSRTANTNLVVDDDDETKTRNNFQHYTNNEKSINTLKFNDASSKVKCLINKQHEQELEKLAAGLLLLNDDSIRDEYRKFTKNQNNNLNQFDKSELIIVEDLSRKDDEELKQMEAAEEEVEGRELVVEDEILTRDLRANINTNQGIFAYKPDNNYDFSFNQTNSFELNKENTTQKQTSRSFNYDKEQTTSSKLKNLRFFNSGINNSIKLFKILRNTATNDNNAAASNKEQDEYDDNKFEALNERAGECGGCEVGDIRSEYSNTDYEKMRYVEQWLKNVSIFKFIRVDLTASSNNNQKNATNISGSSCSICSELSSSGYNQHSRHLPPNSHQKIISNHLDYNHKPPTNFYKAYETIEF